MTERRLGRRANERQARQSAAARRSMTPVTRSNRFGVVRSPVLGVVLCENTKRPTRTSQTVLATTCASDGRRSWPAPMRVRRTRGFERRHERRAIGVDPELVVDALHQLQARREPPRELPEDLVLLVGPRERRDRCRAGCRSRADTGSRRRTTADRARRDRRGSS